MMVVHAQNLYESVGCWILDSIESQDIVKYNPSPANYPREISQPACGIGLLTQAIN